MFQVLAQSVWPDGIDAVAVAYFIGIAFGLPLLGYLFMVLDFRAYLRSLRRAMIVVRSYAPDLPEWVRKETPRCLLALGLTLPCTEDDVYVAYRRKVKKLHPDRGGNRDEFLRLQSHFEQSLAFIRAR
jgi:hypothetical protein